MRRLGRPGGDISYRVDGEGPPLLMFHSTLSEGRHLRSLAASLAADFTVYRVDRRGSGESAAAAPDPAAPIDVAVHIEDVAALVAHEGSDSAVVVGHSYGGCIALEMAARRPELVRSVVAYEPPYVPVAPPETRELTEDVGRRMLADAASGDLAAAALTFMRGVSGDAAVEALSPAARARIGRAGTGAVADATLLGMDPAELSAISCPTLILTGRDVVGRYAAIADALAMRIPGALRDTIDGDHMAPITRPDAVHAAIAAFVTT
jgi:pimeloyl-ACP methyl ester carboxylesterase